MAAHKSLSYEKIYVLLLALFIVSVAGPEIAEILNIEGVTRLILVLTTAFGIALVKAYYVCAYFMHLKFEKIYAPYLLATCVFLMMVLFFGVAIDAMKSEGHNWIKEYNEPELAPGETGGHLEHGDDAVESPAEGGHGHAH